LKASWAALAAAGLSLAAVGASLWISQNIFETIPHVEDEFANLWQAKVMASGRIALPSPPEPESLLVPFVVDDHGWRFGKYPPGWPAALAIGAWLGFRIGNHSWRGCGLVGLSTGLAVGRELAASGILPASFRCLMLSGSLMPILSIVLTWFDAAWFDRLPRAPARRAVPKALVIAASGLDGPSGAHNAH
jgi:hypothetical protein